MRWQRPVRLLVAVVGIGCAVALAVYSRKRPPPAETPPVLEDQTVSSQRNGVLNIRTNVNTGKEELKIEAELETGYADGRTRLNRAHFTTKRANGTVFEIWAGVAESQGKAVKGDEPGLIHLSGGVRTRSSDGLEVTTDNATYDNIQGLATIPGKLTFARGRLTGEGVGATYDRERDILWLLDEAHVARAPDEKGGGAIDASAKGIGLARPDRFMNLREHAKVVQPDQTIAADQLLIHFTDDDRGARLIEMHGNARVTPTGEATGGNAKPGTRTGAPDMQADEMVLEFHDDGQTLRHATLAGKARLTQRTDQGTQTISAGEMDIVTAPDGRTLMNLQAKTGVEVLLPASGENPDRTIRAASLVASGDESGLRAAIFDGGITFIERSGGGRTGRGSRGAAPAAVDRTGTSATLALELKGQLGAIQSAEFRQHVNFRDGDMKATADRAVHNEAQGTLELIAAKDAKTGPSVEDSAVHVDAMWIQVDLTTHDVRARDKIKTRMTPGRAGAGDTRTPALFEAGQPVYGTGTALKYVSALKAATFAATPALLARVYQSDGANFIEAAQRIDLDQQSGNLQATGQVKSTFVLEDAGASARRGREAAPKAAPPKAAAGKAGAAVSGPTAEQTTPTVVAAQTMTYYDADRKVVYDGEPAKPVTLKGPDGDVIARQIVLMLAKDQRALKTLEATGEMSATFEGGREAMGDRLTYDATTETHVITGKPMYFKNVQTDGGKKSCYLEKSTELHYEGKDKTITEPGSDTKALSPSVLVVCDKPLKTLIVK